MKRVLQVILTAALAATCTADRGSEHGTTDSRSEGASSATPAQTESASQASPGHDETGPSSAAPAADNVAAAPVQPESTIADEPDPFGPGRIFDFARPDDVRGLYVNAWSAGSRRRITALNDLARRTEVNSFVVDIKDATGFISHPTDIPLAIEIGATDEIRIPNLRVLLDRLEKAGVYPIARIVIVKDPLIAAARPDMAVQDTAGGPWSDDKGIVWLNPYNREVWDYHVAIAREVAEIGFPEIQWDYVRFPDAPRSAMNRAHFPGRDGRERSDAIREFLAYSRDALSDLDVEVTADVFGVTTTATRDVGIGQVWESFIDVVDVALPMVYPSHYWKGSFGFDDPNSHPYEIVRAALEDALERSAVITGAGATRPWLQDFDLGPPRYDAPEVRAQIQAAYDVGIDEWILWNPGSRYTEEALEPVDGFIEEPLLRMANQIVPVSRRFELYDTTTVVVDPEAAEGTKTPGNPGAGSR